MNDATEGRTGSEATQTAPVLFGLTTWSAPARHIFAVVDLPSARATITRRSFRSRAERHTKRLSVSAERALPPTALGAFGTEPSRLR